MGKHERMNVGGRPGASADGSIPAGRSGASADGSVPAGRSGASADAVVSRRGLLKGVGAGALVVTIGGAVGLDFVKATGKALAQGAKPPLHPEQLDSYLAIGADGRVSVPRGQRTPR